MSHDVTATRQLAALRRQGWSTLDAITMVAPALDEGPVRGACQRAEARLRAGGAPAGDDVLEALLSQGEAASPEALECLARSHEAGLAAERTQGRAAVLLGTFVVGPLLLASLAGWFDVGRFYLSLEAATLPAPTRLLLEALGVARWAGPPLAAAATAFFVASARRKRRGGRDFDGAAQLLQLASALGAGQSEGDAIARLGARTLPPSLAVRFSLGPNETRFLEWARTTVGLAAGARALAEEKLAEGVLRQRRFERIAPLLLTVLFGMAVGAVFVALYGPVFRIAGSIK